MTLETAWKLLNISKSKQTQFTKFEKCKDNYVGKLSCKKSNLFISKELREQNKRLCSKMKVHNNKNIIIILESPHKSEYSGTIPFPALGNTGLCLNYYLHEIMYKFLQNKKRTYKVFLLNCVPYQCSLGGNDRNIKNKIFKHMFNEYWKKDLLKRIKKLKPSIVLVATTQILLKTKNKKKIYLKYQLLEDIRPIIKQKCNLYYSSTHPSAWFNKFEIYDYKNNNKLVFAN